MSATAADRNSDPRGDPDVQLMLRVRQNDHEAFNTLMDRHYYRVYQQLLCIVWHHQDAEDLTQDVFLRVYSHRKTYWPQAKFTTWLFPIVLNVGRNACRSRSRHARRFSQLSETAVVEIHDPKRQSPQEILQHREQRHQVERVMNTVSDRQRTALRLYYLQGYSRADIALRLRTTRSAVDGLLSRGRRQLQHSSCFDAT